MYRVFCIEKDGDIKLIKVFGNYNMCRFWLDVQSSLGNYYIVEYKGKDVYNYHQIKLLEGRYTMVPVRLDSILSVIDYLERSI